MKILMFKSGYTLRLFQILEDDVVDFLTYIPLEYYSADERKKIFSPRLAELLIRIGSQIDIFFRNWDIVQKENPKLTIDNLKFCHYKNIERNNRIILSNRQIKVLATNETITPFRDWININKNSEFWWNAYNHVKHNGFTYKEEGNLKNVIESLSALFLLNYLHEETQTKLCEYGYKKPVTNAGFHVWSPYITSKLFITL